MKRIVLKKKPLVEAIFELRWKLDQIAPGLTVDPHYKLLVGRLYDKLRDEYPCHEQLPAATLPDEVAGQIVQHRFRKERNGWPLVQLGPGILTINDTEGYVWEDFDRRISTAIRTLFEVYPRSERILETSRLTLRYIDAIPFDFGADDIFAFLSTEMKSRISLYEGLFTETGVNSSPVELDLKFSFATERPEGVAGLRIFKGRAKEVDALIWEQVVESPREGIETNAETIKEWSSQAHDLADDWFFKLIEGDLLRRFQ